MMIAATYTLKGICEAVKPLRLSLTWISLSESVFPSPIDRSTRQNENPFAATNHSLRAHCFVLKRLQ